MPILHRAQSPVNTKIMLGRRRRRRANRHWVNAVWLMLDDLFIPRELTMVRDLLEVNKPVNLLKCLPKNSTESMQAVVDDIGLQ